MKFTKTLLAIALPVALSAGCAMDVGSNADGLTIDTNNDFGINACGNPVGRWLGEAEWPVDTIVAGDMEFTKGELVDYVRTNPGVRADLISEIAAAQLNMATALVIPEGVINDLVAADDLLMAPDDGTGTPPLVNIEDFGNISDFNDHASLGCFFDTAQVAQESDRTVDTRDNVLKPSVGTSDLRANLFVDE